MSKTQKWMEKTEENGTFNSFEIERPHINILFQYCMALLTHWNWCDLSDKSQRLRALWHELSSFDDKDRPPDAYCTRAKLENSHLMGWNQPPPTQKHAKLITFDMLKVTQKKLTKANTSGVKITKKKNIEENVVSRFPVTVLFAVAHCITWLFKPILWCKVGGLVQMDYY